MHSNYITAERKKNDYYRKKKKKMYPTLVKMHCWLYLKKIFEQQWRYNIMPTSPLPLSCNIMTVCLSCPLPGLPWEKSRPNFVIIFAVTWAITERQVFWCAEGPGLLKGWAFFFSLFRLIYTPPISPPVVVFCFFTEACSWSCPPPPPTNVSPPWVKKTCRRIDRFGDRLKIA